MLEKTDGQLRTLEDLVSNIEFSQIQASVYHGLERGNEVLKEIHKTLNAESVEKLLEQTSEAQERQRVSTKHAMGMVWHDHLLMASLNLIPVLYRKLMKCLLRV